MVTADDHLPHLHPPRLHHPFPPHLHHPIPPHLHHPILPHPIPPRLHHRPHNYHVSFLFCQYKQSNAHDWALPDKQVFQHIHYGLVYSQSVHSIFVPIHSTSLGHSQFHQNNVPCHLCKW